ncbi:MAG: YciI family protein [Saprospiraceae bacterium]|nr:YciI family protein [Saprospiraceae bacterium]
MKRNTLILLIASILVWTQCQNQPKSTEQAAVEPETIAYDSLTAQKWGADEYGMKPYVMAFLKAGPNRDQDSLAAAQLQEAHMANINRMAEEGKLILAGPFLDDGDIRGIYIFDVRTVEEAKALTETDPAIQAGRLVMELHPWYGSAAMMELNQLHKKGAKKEI